MINSKNEIIEQRYKLITLLKERANKLSEEEIHKLIKALEELAHVLIEENENDKKNKLTIRDIAEINCSAELIKNMIYSFMAEYELDDSSKNQIDEQTKKYIAVMESYFFRAFHDNPKKFQGYASALEEIHNSFDKTNNSKSLEDYRKYRKDKIAELQEKYFRKKVNLNPKNGYVTIIVKYYKKYSSEYIFRKFKFEEFVTFCKKRKLEYDIYAIIFGNGITEIPDQLCAQIEDLEYCIMPEDLKKIGDFSFSDTGISELYLPPKVTHIGDSAFAISQDNKDQSRLPNLTISATVKYIGEKAFENQAALKDVKFLGDKAEIMSSVFSGTPYGESRAANRRDDGEEH